MEPFSLMALLSSLFSSGAAAAGAGAGAAALPAVGAATGGLMAMPSMAAGVGSMLGPAGAMSAEGLLAPSVGGLMSASSLPAAAESVSPLVQNAKMGMGLLKQAKSVFQGSPPPAHILLPRRSGSPLGSGAQSPRVISQASQQIGGGPDASLQRLAMILRQRGGR